MYWSTQASSKLTITSASVYHVSHVNHFVQRQTSHDLYLAACPRYYRSKQWHRRELGRVRHRPCRIVNFHPSIAPLLCGIFNHLYSPMTVVIKERNNKTHNLTKQIKHSHITQILTHSSQFISNIFANGLHNVLSENCNFVRKLSFLSYIAPETEHDCMLVTGPTCQIVIIIIIIIISIICFHEKELSVHNPAWQCTRWKMWIESGLDEWPDNSSFL